MPTPRIDRRSVLTGAFAGLGLGGFHRAGAAAEDRVGEDAPVPRTDRISITKLETFPVQPRWLFLMVHTDAGIGGLGETIDEGRAETVAAAVKEIEPYLVGKDPRQVVHHWQAIYRHAFYRGGPILTSALSGVDMALWEIKGKALGVPVDELLGGPTRTRTRVYAHASSPARINEQLARGFTAFKTQPARHRPAPIPSPPRGPEEAPSGFRCEGFAEAGPVVVAAVDDGVGPRRRPSRTRRPIFAIRRPPRPQGDCPRAGWGAGLRPMGPGPEPDRAARRGGRSDPIQDGRYLRERASLRRSVAEDLGRPRPAPAPLPTGTARRRRARRRVIRVGCPSGRCPAPARGRRTCRGCELTGSLDR